MKRGRQITGGKDRHKLLSKRKISLAGEMIEKLEEKRMDLEMWIRCENCDFT